MKLKLETTSVIIDPETFLPALNFHDCKKIINHPKHNYNTKKDYLEYIRPHLKEFNITEKEIEIDYNNNFYVNFKSEEDAIHYKLKYL